MTLAEVRDQHKTGIGTWGRAMTNSVAVVEPSQLQLSGSTITGVDGYDGATIAAAKLGSSTILVASESFTKEIRYGCPIPKTSLHFAMKRMV